MSSFVKPHISLFDKSFNENLTSSYILSLQLSLHELVFSIYHPENNKYVALQAYHFNNLEVNSGPIVNIDKILKENSWLGPKWESVNIIYSGNKNTIIPLPLFKEDKFETYLKFNHPVDEKSHLAYNAIKSLQAANVFSMPEELAIQVKRLWPNCQIFHLSSVLIESLGINYKNKTDDNTLYVNLRSDSFDVTYFKSNKLHFYNSFQYKTPEDFIYFLLSGIEQLGLNPETAHIVLMGDIDKSTPYYHMVYRYIRHIEFIDRNDTFKYSHVLNEIMQHKYYVLFNALQCE